MPRVHIRGAKDAPKFKDYIPANPGDAVWSVIRTLADRIGERLTTHLRAIADENALLKGIIDRVDFNATTLVGAKDQANGGNVVRAFHSILEQPNIHIHLPDVLMGQLAGFQVDQ